MITDISLTSTSLQSVIRRRDGNPIPVRSWGTAQDCKAVALLVHGLGAHSGWFEAFARQLKVRRIYVVSYDQAGFGKRSNDTIEGYSTWVDDLVCVFDRLQEMIPGKPIYLCGNSMGALVSMSALPHIKPSGLVLLSPGFDGHPHTFTMQYRLGAIVKAMINPRTEIGLPYDAAVITRDEATREWIERDADGRFSVPGKFAVELLKLSNSTKKSTCSVSVPVLMMTAGCDRIVNNGVNTAFFNRLIAPAKKHKHFPDAFHDLMFDPVVDEVAEEVVSWLPEHINERLVSGPGA
jgi:alpha-beta hydrolase superfamily lysophospholipase